MVFILSFQHSYISLRNFKYLFQHDACNQSVNFFFVIRLIDSFLNLFMTTSNINIKVDSLGSNGYSKSMEEISVEISLQKVKVLMVNQKIRSLTGQKQTPFLVIELQSSDIREFIGQKQTLKETLYEYNHIIKDNKNYYWGNFKSEETKRFVKNLQHQFIKLTQLQNWIKLSISLSDVQEMKDKQHLWQNTAIKGQVKIDSKFVPLLKQLLQKVSPQFIDSPLVILLQQLQMVDLDLNLKSFQLPQFIEQLVKKYVGSELLKNKLVVEKLRGSKQQITIRITIGQLLSIKITGNAFLTLLTLL